LAFLLDVPLAVMMGDVSFLVNMVEILNQWEVSRAGAICLSEDFFGRARVKPNPMTLEVNCKFFKQVPFLKVVIVQINKYR
jgi:hypothetical protein